MTPPLYCRIEQGASDMPRGVHDRKKAKSRGGRMNRSDAMIAHGREPA